MKKTGSPILAVITKTDKVTKDRLAERIVEVSQMHDFAEIVPVSAVAGSRSSCWLPLARAHAAQPAALSARLDYGRVRRNTDCRAHSGGCLLGVCDELPHSIAVVVDELEERPRREGDSRPPILAIHASLYVERASQKGIIIGKGGSRLKRVGRQGRESIERLLGRQVYLDLYVKVAKRMATRSEDARAPRILMKGARRRLPLVLMWVLAVLVLGAWGGWAGPGWNPQPMTNLNVPETHNTKVVSAVKTARLGTYEVATSVHEVPLGDGTLIKVTLREPLGLQGRALASSFCTAPALTPTRLSHSMPIDDIDRRRHGGTG